MLGFPSHDPGPISNLVDIFQQLKKRIRLNLPKRLEKLRATPEIRTIGRETPTSIFTRTGSEAGTELTGRIAPEAQRSLREASRFTDQLDMASLSRLRLNLRNLISGDKSLDRLVLEAIDALETSAERAGIRGLKEARKQFKKAKEFEEKFLKFADRADKKAENLLDTQKLESKILLNL